MPKKGNSHNKNVTARQRKKQGAHIAALLVGDRGSGKSRFLIDDLKMHFEDVYYNEFGEQIDWSNPDYDKIDKIRDKVIMCVIDFDIEGQEQLIMRISIMPDEICDSFNKWPVTGSPEDSEEYIHRFEDGQEALLFYLKMMRDHKSEYPEGRRILVLEDLAETYDSVLDHFFYVTTKGKVKSFKDQFVKQTMMKVAIGKDAPKDQKAEAALFPLGQRETFGMVNLEYKDFIHNCIRYKRDYDYSFYCTTRIGIKREDDDTLQEYNLGRTYLIEGYLDLILRFKKVTKKKGGEEITKYIIDTKGDSAKNRLSPDFWIEAKYPNVARSFFERLKKEQSDEDSKMLIKGE